MVANRNGKAWTHRPEIEPQMKLMRAERMPLGAGDARTERPEVRHRAISLDFGESPVFLQFSH